ncbi:MAG: hypothetical protein H6935_00385 [Thiobacillus sp.]|nr:hypothetical protein [Thiobacillus sp.]
MSTNTIRACLEVSFKGETLTLETHVDLDKCPGEPGQPPDFHRMLARAAGVDPYSYLYEALESEDIAFSEPTGLAVLAFEDGVFDWTRFEHASRAAQDWQAVRAIAANHLGSLELDGDADLRAALLAVYRAGRDSA